MSKVNMNSGHEYELLDSGNGKKLERFGQYILIRPSSQAIWKMTDKGLWSKAHSEFVRQGKETGDWNQHKTVQLPKTWIVRQDGLMYTIEPNNYGNVGLFPEHWSHLEWMHKAIGKIVQPQRILNLFSYSGSGSLALVHAGHELTNVDSSRQSMDLLSRNLEINDLKGKTRLILEDVTKFLQKEVKRGSRYDAVILDPPTYGKGKEGETFRIERDLNQLLELVQQVLEPRYKFVLFTCHTPGYTSTALKNLFLSTYKTKPEVGEVELTDTAGRVLPAGVYARLRNS